MHTCKICQQQKPEDQMSWSSKGDKKYTSYCKECMRDSRKKAYRKVRKEMTLEGRAKALAAACNAYAKKSNVTEKLSYEDILPLLKDSNCYYCDIEIKMEKVKIDHTIPFTRGGKNEKSNLVACCAVCKLVKKHYNRGILDAWVKHIKSS